MKIISTFTGYTLSIFLLLTLFVTSGSLANPPLVIGDHHAGGIIIRLPSATTPGLVIAEIDGEFAGKHWNDAATACASYTAGTVATGGPYTGWRLPTVLELEQNVFPNRRKIPGLKYECSRPSNGAQTSPPYSPDCDPVSCTDCSCTDPKCNYWSSNNGNTGVTKVQVSLTSPNPCHQAANITQGFCRSRPVRTFVF